MWGLIGASKYGSNDTLTGPMTCGVLHPAIVLPQDAENWNQADLNRAIIS